MEEKSFTVFYPPTSQLSLISFNLQTKTKEAPPKVKCHLPTHSQYKQKPTLAHQSLRAKNHTVYSA